MVPTGKISEEKSDFFGRWDDLKKKKIASFVILFSPCHYFPEYLKQIQRTSIFFNTKTNKPYFKTSIIKQ